MRLFTPSVHGRLVTAAPKRYLLRKAVGVTALLGAGFFLMMSCTDTVHAAPVGDQATELKAAAEALNSACRDSSASQVACEGRDAALRALERKNVCWVARGRESWSPCRPPAATAPEVMTQGPSCARVGGALEMVANLRDHKAPAEIAIEVIERDAPDVFKDPTKAVWAVYTGALAYLPPAMVRNQTQAACMRARGLL